MSPVSRGRKKKPKRRQPNRHRAPYQVILANAEVLNTVESTVAAELWASEMLGELWINCWIGDVDDPDVEFESVIEAFVAYLMRANTPVALSALRALTRVGEMWAREVFGAAADKLADDGLPEPAWAQDAGEPELFEAYSVRDQFGDIESIALGYRHGSFDHVVAILVDHAAGVNILKLAVTALPENGTAEVAEQFAVGIPDACPAVLLTADEVCFRLEGPVNLMYEDGPEALTELVPRDGQSHPVPGLAFLRARVDALTDEFIETIDPDAVVIEFLASERAKSLPDKDFARSWATLWTRAAAGYGRLPTQAGPLSLAYLATVILPEHFTITDADLDLLPDIIRAWAHFTVDAAGLDASAHQLWDEQLPQLLTDLLDAYRDEGAVESRALADDMLDLRTLLP